MRKLFVAAIVSCLVAGAFGPAQAAKKKKPKKITRVAEAAYIAPARFYWAPTGDNIGGATFPAALGEAYVSLEIVDDAGMDVAAAVGQDPEGDNQVSIIADFCTKTEEPVPIQPGLEVTVFVYVGPCTSPSPAPALATQGKVIATFSNLP